MHRATQLLVVVFICSVIGCVKTPLERPIYPAQIDGREVMQDLHLSNSNVQIFEVQADVDIIWTAWSDQGMSTRRNDYPVRCIIRQGSSVARLGEYRGHVVFAYIALNDPKREDECPNNIEFMLRASDVSLQGEGEIERQNRQFDVERKIILHQEDSHE